LKRAFGATLEELESADLLIHVVDASSRYAEEQLEAVESLLKELDLHLVPRLTVFNKIDLLDDPQVAEHMAQRWEGMALSALDRKSLLPLVQRIERMLWEEDSAVSTERTTGETDEEELRA
jgi:GTP-binding protein HflX